MGVEITQFNRAVEKVTEGYLKKGVLPSVSKINADVQNIFEERHAGLPRFTFRESFQHKPSSLQDYNSMFEEAYEDLIVSYEDIKRLSNEILSIVSYYESNRIKVNRMLYNLETLNEMLEESALSKKDTNVFWDNFTDFTKIDFFGNTKKNISGTTAFVNLLTNDVELQRKKGETLKVDLTNATITFRANKGETTHLSPLRASVIDTMYDSWRAVVQTEDDTGVTGVVTYEIPDAQYASNVTVYMQNGRKLSVLLEISSNGIDFKRLESRRILHTYQWVFTSQPVKAFRITIVQPDSSNTNGKEFDYRFGMKNVELKNVPYEDKVVLTSKSFKVENIPVVEKISLEADDIVVPGTSIRYFAGLEYKNEMIEWKELKNGKTIETGDVTTKTLIANRRTNGYGKFVSEKFGMKFYKMFEVEMPIEYDSSGNLIPQEEALFNIIPNSTTIYMGRNMWSKEIIPAPFTYSPTNDESDKIVYPTGAHDWVRTASPRRGFVRIQNRIDFLQSDHFHRYTTYIQAVEQEDISATIYGSDDTSWAVYVNNRKVKGVNGKFALRLNKGWNKIEVYVYAREVNQEIILDFYSPSMKNEIFAEKDPMKEITLYDLMHNTTQRTLNCFAIDGRSIILNYDPKRLDMQSDYIEAAKSTQKENATVYSDGVEYDITYKLSNTPHTLHHLRFMATMEKENDNINSSPLLKSYKIKVQ